MLDDLMSLHNGSPILFLILFVVIVKIVTYIKDKSK